MLEGNFTILRSIENKDLKKLLYWRNLEKFRKHFREYRELNYTQQKIWFENVVKGDKNTIMFSILSKKTKELLGVCGLCYIDWVNKNADFSIYIGKKEVYIDTKFAPDASKILLNYGFSNLGLHRIWAEIYDFDKKKINFFKKLFFKLDGKHRETYWCNNEWNDSLFYSILINEFNKKIRKNLKK